MTTGTRTTTTLIIAAEKTGYVLYVTNHSNTYIQQAPIHTRILIQRSSYNGRLQTFLFEGDDKHHTSVLYLYAFQRGHEVHKTD